MDQSIAEQILDELLPSFESVEAQSGAVLQFLKDKKIATDEQLAPYMEQARSASAIRWNAVRLRMNRLLAPAFKTAEKSTEQKPSAPQTKPTEEKGEGPQKSPAEKERKKEDQRQDKSAAEAKKDVTPATENRGKKKDSDRPEKGAA
jgi:hypothetical protein